MFKFRNRVYVVDWKMDLLDTLLVFFLVLLLGVIMLMHIGNANLREPAYRGPLPGFGIECDLENWRACSDLPYNYERSMPQGPDKGHSGSRIRNERGLEQGI